MCCASARSVTTAIGGWSVTSIILETPQNYSDVARLRGQQVLFYQEFGSYQGEWFCLARKDDLYYLYEGWYGSCSGCDDIQGTWGYYDNPPPSEPKLREWLDGYRAFAEVPRDTACRLAMNGTLVSILPSNIREMNSNQVARECEVLIKLEEGLGLDTDDALDVINQETRRRVIEQLGIAEFFVSVGAELIHEDGHDRLMSFGALRGAQRYLWLQDASTPRQYVLRVPRDMQRVRQAKAWSFGISEAEYKPEIET